MLSVNFTVLSAPLGIALRCDFSNITSAALSTVVVVSLGMSDGTTALVSPTDPLNQANCTATAAGGGLSLRALHRYDDDEEGVTPAGLAPAASSASTIRRPRQLTAPGATVRQLTAPGATVVYINVSAVLPQHAVMAAVTAIENAPYTAFAAVAAVTQADPGLLVGGAGAPGIDVGPGKTTVAVFQTSATAAPTLSFTSSGSGTATPSGPAPTPVRSPDSSLGGVSPQGAAIIGGTVAAIVAVFAAGVVVVMALGRRKRAVGDRYETASLDV